MADHIVIDVLLLCMIMTLSIYGSLRSVTLILTLKVLVTTIDALRHF